MSATYILQVEALSISYGLREVVHDVSFNMVRSDRIALIGPNGCGKSTLLKCVAGVLKSNAGRISLNRLELQEQHRSQHESMAYLRQTKNIFAGLTVKENLELAYRGGVHEQRKGFEGRLAYMTGHFNDVLSEEKLGIRAGLLSGGERQALAVAMVLMQPVDVLLLDEPIAGLEAEHAHQLLETVMHLQDKEGFALLMVEHRLRQIQPWVNRVLIMREGRFIADHGDSKILGDRDKLADYYL